MHNEAAKYLEDKIAEPCLGLGQKPLQLPPTIFHAIDNSSLPFEEKSKERLAQESFVLIAAGTDTTSRAFTYALYHLIANPEILKRLQGELSAIMPQRTSSPDLKQLKELPFFVSMIPT